MGAARHRRPHAANPEPEPRHGAYAGAGAAGSTHDPLPPPVSYDRYMAGRPTSAAAAAAHYDGDDADSSGGAPAAADAGTPVQIVANPIGIYGWRKKCLYATVLLLTVLAIINMGLLVYLMYTLRVDGSGAGPLRFEVRCRGTGGREGRQARARPRMSVWGVMCRPAG